MNACLPFVRTHSHPITLVTTPPPPPTTSHGLPSITPAHSQDPPGDGNRPVSQRARSGFWLTRQRLRRAEGEMWMTAWGGRSEGRSPSSESGAYLARNGDASALYACGWQAQCCGGRESAVRSQALEWRRLTWYHNSSSASSQNPGVDRSVSNVFLESCSSAYLQPS